MPPPALHPPLTHFLCVQLVTPASREQLSSSLAAFKADITDPGSFNVPAKAVRPMGTLHLTLGMMSFPDNEGLDKATTLLRELKPRDVLKSVLQPPVELAGAQSDLPSHLLLTLRGLRSMQSPQNATVLYAPPSDPNGVLQDFCEKLRSPFLEHGLMVKDDRPLLLHATIVNTIYAKQKARGQGKKQGSSKLTINAVDMLYRYDDYSWMEGVALEKIAICRMGAKPVTGDDEAAYIVEAEVDF